jgi:hypothetical protein
VLQNIQTIREVIVPNNVLAHLRPFPVFGSDKISQPRSHHRSKVLVRIVLAILTIRYYISVSVNQVEMGVYTPRQASRSETIILPSFLRAMDTGIKVPEGWIHCSVVRLEL